MNSVLVKLQHSDAVRWWKWKREHQLQLLEMNVLHYQSHSVRVRHIAISQYIKKAVQIANEDNFNKRIHNCMHCSSNQCYNILLKFYHISACFHALLVIFSNFGTAVAPRCSG